MKTETAKELLKLQTSADIENTNNSTYSREPLDGTPFTIVTLPDVGAFLSMGKFRLTEPMENREQVLNWMDENMWALMAQVAHCIANEITNQKINQQ